MFISDDGQEISVRIEAVDAPEGVDYTYFNEWVKITAGTGRYYEDRLVTLTALNDDGLITEAITAAVESILALLKDRKPIQTGTDGD